MYVNLLKLMITAVTRSNVCLFKEKHLINV